jgi:hypothetical protein
MIYYILIWFLLLLIIFSIFLLSLSKKINNFEQKIISLFFSRSNNIPALYEVTKDYIIKHNQVFKNSINLRKQELSQIDNQSEFITILQTETLIHKELNFILKLAKKHNEILKDNKFLYIREIIIDKSYNISENVELYKKIIKKYNKLVNIKNLTILGFFIPIYKKQSI